MNNPEPESDWNRAIIYVPHSRVLDIFTGRVRAIGLPKQYRVIYCYEHHVSGSLAFVVETPEVGPTPEGCQYPAFGVTWTFSTAIELIAQERATHGRRGYDAGHDAGHDKGELLDAGLSYLHCAINQGHPTMKLPPAMWPFASEEFHGADPVRNLVKAGSLIAAEIDRRLALPLP